MDINPPQKTLFQSYNSMRSRAAGWIGTTGVVLMALGLGPSTTAVSIGLLLLLAGSLLVIDDMARSLSRGSFLLPAGLTLLLLFVTLWAIHQLHVDAGPAWKEFKSLAKIAGLPALALGWWLVHGRLRIHHFLALLIVGLLLRFLDGIDFETALHTLLESGKIISNVKSKELGFLASVLFMISVGSLLLNARTRSALTGSSKLWNTIFILTAIVSGYLVIISQTRSIVLAIGFALVLILLLRIIIHRRQSRQHGRRHLAISVLVVALLGLVLISPMGKIVVERFDGLGKGFTMLISGDREHLAGLSESFRHRILMWHEGVSLTAEAPLTGHGPGTARSLLANAFHGEIDYSHFHNFWIHLLVVIGIPGALGFVILFASYAVKSFKSVVEHDSYMGWLSLGLWAFFLVDILAQFRINHTAAEAFVILAGGMSFYAVNARQKAAQH